jgi:hypothetical protein
MGKYIATLPIPLHTLPSHTIQYGLNPSTN